MEPEDFYSSLPAVWLVFGGSFLNHNNAPRPIEDKREQTLVELLRSYLHSLLVDSTLIDGCELDRLTAIHDLLKIWAEDLNIIYQIRSRKNGRESLIRQMAQRLLQRIKTFYSITVIPNGLIAAKHFHMVMKPFRGCHENVNLAVLTRQSSCINWTQVDPGSAYHQRCLSFDGEKSNTCLEISNIDPDDITEDWLSLLVGLKSVSLMNYDFSYSETSLYECLLAHLNGQTVFQSEPDESFTKYSRISPVHTWQVLSHSFRCILKHFFGETYQVVYKRLITGFKLFLMTKTFAAYEDKGRKEKQECHFLLQEMCQNVALDALDQDNIEQKEYALQLIDVVKVAIEKHYCRLELLACLRSQLRGEHISSLSFPAPDLNNPMHTSDVSKESYLKADPVFVIPRLRTDVLGFLEQFKRSFFDKLSESENLDDIAILSYGIETFFKEIFNRNILQVSCDSPFSSNDTYFAECIIEIAEKYHGAQSLILHNFLPKNVYHPQLYAKNVVIQFFAYAAVAALNLRDEHIGPLLRKRNLSIATSLSLTLETVIPHLIIEDAEFLKMLISTKTFFTKDELKSELFSCDKFRTVLRFKVRSDAENFDNDVSFAYKLLKRDEETFRRFTSEFRNIPDDQFSRKWLKLTYSDTYLPSLYCSLSKIAHLAKVSLTGFPVNRSKNPVVNIKWAYSKHEYSSEVKFCIYNCALVYTKRIVDQSYNYVLNSNPYQNLIAGKSMIDTSESHLQENEIIASQNYRPNNMDRVRYMHLGFLQSESQLKIERLYIALKDQQLDVSCTQETILLKQTLFEVSDLIKTDNSFYSILQLTAERNPDLIHNLGLLLVEKLRAMQYRLTQHRTIGEILEVILGLVTFYPSVHKNEFIEGIKDVSQLLKIALLQPSSNLSDETLMYLNAYLIMTAQANPDLFEMEISTVLKALFAIQNFNAKGLRLNNIIQLCVLKATFLWRPRLRRQLDENPTLLNDLMSNVIPQWDQSSCWQSSSSGILYTCGDHAIKPLEGAIFFKKRPIRGLPDTIKNNWVFMEYFRQLNFTVISASRKMGTKEVACYLSVDLTPPCRLTSIQNSLLIEEWVEGENDYQRYIPTEELLSQKDYPNFFYRLPFSKDHLTHWLNNQKKIFFKDKDKQIIYEWDLRNNFVYSFHRGGYVVPWDQLQDSSFKACLESIERTNWIEIIAQQTSDESKILIQSIHFPRLGLHFDRKHGKFYSRQIHGYALAQSQTLNTLHGFTNYLILEKIEKDSTVRRTKVIIPHRKVTPEGSFYSNAAKANLDEVQSSSYFVYDDDVKTGLLKSHNIGAQLYLALLYYCTASLDDHDVCNCNAYHLARENLEKCVSDQPFDEIELDVIEQFLSPAAMRDFHSNRIALYLKVTALLSSSLHLSFLYQDKIIQQNKERSDKLLVQRSEYLPYLLLLYIQNETTVFARLRLDLDEKKELMKLSSSSIHLSQNSSDSVQEDIELLQTTLFSLNAYRKIYLEQSTVSLSSRPVIQSYKDSYELLFCKNALKDTTFLNIFAQNLHRFNFDYTGRKLNFSSGFSEIMYEHLRLVHFVHLYKLARSSNVKIEKFRYLLHHLVIKAKMDYATLPEEVVMMLGRAILLVAEIPHLFPQAPLWFGVSRSSVKLSERTLTKQGTLEQFQFSWKPDETYNSDTERDAAMMEARTIFKKQNEQIWYQLLKHDLNERGVPLMLPRNSEKFTLEYEKHINFSHDFRQQIVRNLYFEAACNDSMHQFFVRILQICDEQKYLSDSAWKVATFTDNPITLEIKGHVRSPSSHVEPISLEKWSFPSESLIDLNDYFIITPKAAPNQDFIFENQLREPDNGYQHEFYLELKESWKAHRKDTEFDYSWRSSQCELKNVLQTKYKEIRKQMDEHWKTLAELLNERPNSEADNYFALCWHGGQILRYHKGDILKLLAEPHKLVEYNPNCVLNLDTIIEKLLLYVSCDINAVKIDRMLALIAQYQHAESEPERLSSLHDLVKSLQEKVDPMSFSYPHWFLFQFEHELIIRDNQCELIIAMLNESDKAMYQLNMGEGKSSVILPLLSTYLANGKKLLRIIVLPSLLTTMKDFLRQRFSNLIRKRIFTLPFNRDTDISIQNLRLILKTLEYCQLNQHILLVTPEHRLCLQLKVREMMLENQQQIGATDKFNWKTYRQHVGKIEVYQDLTEEETTELLEKQDNLLKKCLMKNKYLAADDHILKVPPRGQGRKDFAKFKDSIQDASFREWSCLKAAYHELLYNSTLAYHESSEKLKLLNKITALSAIDLLDESDEILKHGTELNYTIGDKHAFAGGEYRWQIPQLFINAIFCNSEVRNVIIAGKANGFTAFNLNYSLNGGVPFIQLLNESYFENSIKPLLMDIFFSENLPTLRQYNVSLDTYPLRDYVAGKLSLKAEKNLLAFLAKDKGALKDKVLIAKGWLSHGILFHVFHSKYRVQYGLNFNAQGQPVKSIAIPFMGKDAPSPRSEFSHPDVMVGFTFISYLYQGLSKQQLKNTLLKLKDLYSYQTADRLLLSWAEAGRAWIEPQTESFPPIILTSLKYLDLSDKQCLDQVHQYLSCNHLAILFFLNQFIFSQEAMQYLYKISANAHSLVGYDDALGFSGTDDRKITLPFEVKSRRSTTQEGTNGKLLSVLTQERNSWYYSSEAEDTTSLLKELCLYVVRHPHCHALIDAGALVTGYSNLEVASFLLANLPSNFSGVLYFSDEGNNLTVLTRDKKTVTLQDCYLDKRCLFAYLDDVHTRGTDIKLPVNCHAILTVGMDMQKDKLMQAAMRLRQLALQQSVSLWGTQAVTLAISRDNAIDATMINSFEVIKWVTRNTIDHINSDLFHVAIRKINFQFLKKAEGWLKKAPVTLLSLVKYCQDEETFSLEEFYGVSPQRQDLADWLLFLVAGRIRTFWQEIDEELQKKHLNDNPFYDTVLNHSNKNSFRKLLNSMCQELAVYLQIGYVSGSLEDDEEKEVEVEVIQEQEIKIKVDERSAKYEIPWDVQMIRQQDFINLAKEKNIIKPLKSIQKFVHVPENLGNIIWHSDIFMTSNYIQSVECKRKEFLDNYLRPVDAIVLLRSPKTIAVVLTGKEAAKIKLHFYPECDDILLVHITDVDGPTQLPKGSVVSKEEQKLLTIIKLFSGECHYPSSNEVLRLAKRIGRLYPQYFSLKDNPIDLDFSMKLFGLLIERGYLDYAGMMTNKLFSVLMKVQSHEPVIIDLPVKYDSFGPLILRKLYRTYTKLVFQPSHSLRDQHYILWQWVSTRGRLKEYVGSVLESVINSEFLVL